MAVGGGSGGLTANSPGSVKSLMNYFNTKGYTNSSIDYLFANHKNGIVNWWADSEGAQYGQFNTLKLSGNWYGPGGKQTGYLEQEQHYLV